MNPTDDRDPSKLPDLSRPHLADTMPEPIATATLKAIARREWLALLARVTPTSEGV